MGPCHSQASSFAHGFTALVLLATPGTLLAQEPTGGWVGKRVVPRTIPFTLKSGDRTIAVKDGFGPYRVEEVEGPRLRLGGGSGRVGGWADANSVIPVDTAIKHFSEEIRTHPRDPRGYILRATVWRDEKKEFEIALGDCNDAIRLDATSPVPYTTRGLVWLAKGDHDRAIGDFNDAIALDPADAPALFARATAYRSKGEGGRTLEDLEAALRADSSFAPAYTLRGEIRAAAGDQPGAFAEFDQAIRLDPWNCDALVARATIHLAKEDFVRSLADLDAAVRLSPHHKPAIELRATTLARKAKWDARPKTVVEFLARGNEREQEKDHAGAIADFNAAIRLDPENAEAYGARGMAYFDALVREPGDGDEKKAEESIGRVMADLDRSIRLDPKSARAYYNRGIIRFNIVLTGFNGTGHIKLFDNKFRDALDGALDDFSAATRIDPKIVDPHFIEGIKSMALLFWLKSDELRVKGDLDGEMACLGGMIRIHIFQDDKAKATALLARRAGMRRDRGDPDGAVADLDEAVRLAPDVLEFRLKRGDARLAKRDYDKALADFDHVARLRPRDPWPSYNRAVVAFLAGRDVQPDVDAVITRTTKADSLSGYALIIGYFAARRDGREDLAETRLRDAAKNTAEDSWPSPVIRFLRRKLHENVLLLEAPDGDKATEARCFLGLDHLLAGRVDAAREQFRWVKEHGARENIEYTIAVVELERLEAKAKPCEVE